jgi:predicted patatin/cPLA2 family phospholipase
MTIKHIVLGGGGPFGVVAFGALKYLHDIKFWNIKEIKSIYATSVGSLMSVYLPLGYDYDYIYNYFVKRPWEKIFNDIGMENFIDFYNKRGLIDLYPLYYKSFNILLDAKGLSPNITLKEYYDYCGIELYFVTTEINNFNGVILSHKTHPDLGLIMSLCMSGSFPGLFRPVVIGDKCYTDGGIFCNYPIKHCLDDTGCDKNEILGIRKMGDSVNVLINDDSTVFEYFSKMIDNMISYINDEKGIPNIPYDIECDMNIFSSYETWINVPISQEYRATLIDKGSEYAQTYYEKWRQENLVSIVANDDDDNVAHSKAVLVSEQESNGLDNKDL